VRKAARLKQYGSGKAFAYRTLHIEKALDTDLLRTWKHAAQNDLASEH
jgi:hypothetical protein